MFANEEDTKYYDEKFRRYLDELESRILKNSMRVNKKIKKMPPLRDSLYEFIVGR